MKENPEYLRNQSRYSHASLRRNWRFVRIFLALWSVFFVGLFAASILDVWARLGWGFTTTDIWNSLLFLFFGGVMWLFFSLVHSLLLTLVRRTYGPDPAQQGNRPRS